MLFLSQEILSQEIFTRTLLPEEQPNIKHGIKTTERDLMLLKRKALTLTLILSLLVSALAGTLLIQNAESVTVTIISPENKVYSTDNITVAFKIESGYPPTRGNVVFARFFLWGCLLDRSFNISTFWDNNVEVDLSLYGYGYLCNATLTKLSEGPHTITAWVEERINYLSYDLVLAYVYSNVTFNIDSIPPNISILSPENKAYNTSDVPLDFTVNETASQITYSLDEQENVTAAGNMTLTQLSNGAHNVTVYAADEAGNMGASETATFIVAKPEPFSLVPVAVASVAAIAAVSVGLLVYFKKRKKESGDKA
jgi:hypothetical protein